MHEVSLQLPVEPLAKIHNSHPRIDWSLQSPESSLPHTVLRWGQASQKNNTEDLLQIMNTKRSSLLKHRRKFKSFICNSLVLSPFHLKKKLLLALPHVEMTLKSPQLERVDLPCTNLNGTMNIPSRYSSLTPANSHGDQHPASQLTEVLTPILQLDRKKSYAQILTRVFDHPLKLDRKNNHILSQLERNPEFPTSILREALFLCSHSERNPEFSWQLEIEV